MLVLGIETSCDETAAAIVDGDGVVRSDVVHSQIALHGVHGGVVPEIAARDHLKNVGRVTDEALRRANVDLADVGGIAVTVQPGLAGALLVGAQFAKALAFGAQKPLVGVDHLLGHLLAVFLKRDGQTPPVPAFPFVALLASGGHTAIYRVDGPSLEEVRELGATRDDAAGEAYDKVAKLLGLGYPGGPIVDKLAAEGDPKAVAFPTPMLAGDSLEFSFSGLKTFLAQHIEARGVPTERQAIADVCASFQRAATLVLAKKTLRAAKQERAERVVLGGGVAANRGLRAKVRELCALEGRTLFVPEIASCTDNAAMIAYAGSFRLARGDDDGDAIRTRPRTTIPRVTRKGRGAR